MKKFLLAPLLALALAACTTAPGTTPLTAQEIAAQAAIIAKATCSVVPVAADVAVLVTQQTSAGDIAVSADAIAKMICAAVNNLQQRRGAPASVIVNGVTVRLGARRGARSTVLVNGVSIRFAQ